MAKKINYFNIFVKAGKDLTSYKLHNIFDKFISSIDEEQKLKNCSDKSISLNNYIIPDISIGGKQGNYRTIAMAEYRDDKPYAGKKGTSERKNIPDDVFEITRALLVPDEYLMIVEYNHRGCKAAHIGQYIKKFLPDEEFEIVLKQVQQDDVLDKVFKSPNITSLEITIDASITGVVNNLYDYRGDNKPVFVQLTEKSIQTAKDIDANTATFGFSKGQKAGKISHKDIINFIRMMDLNNDGLKKFSVTFIDPDTNKKRNVNLKSEAFISDSIEELEHITSREADEFMRDELLRVYNQKGNEVKSKYKTFGPLKNIDIGEYYGEKRKMV